MTEIPSCNTRVVYSMLMRRQLLKHLLTSWDSSDLLHLDRSLAIIIYCCWRGLGKGSGLHHPTSLEVSVVLKMAEKTYLVYMVGYENKFVSYMCTDGNKVDSYHKRVNLHLFQSISILSHMKSIFPVAGWLFPYAMKIFFHDSAIVWEFCMALHIYRITTAQYVKTQRCH
mgnify:CR=1 FL=1